jgi:hypothetical protein
MPRKPAQDLDEMIAELPTAALACRDLRHAWPRAGRGEMKLTPTKMRGKRVIEAERRMECTGGCGVVRIDTFEFTRDGRMLRTGKPRYQHTMPYLIKRADPADTRVTVDRDALRYALFTRLNPDLQW